MMTGQQADRAWLRHLLQILDDGRVTDSQGRHVSFKNAIIIMTSNLGSASVLEAFGDKQQARDMVMMAVRSHFRPEFINRVDEFIMFDPLEQDQIKAIVRLQVCFNIFSKSSNLKQLKRGNCSCIPYLLHQHC